MILQTYKACNSLEMAKVYLQANGIKSLHVAQHDFCQHRRKPWAVWESHSADTKDGGWPSAEWRTKREAVKVAQELAEWVGIPYVR